MRADMASERMMVAAKLLKDSPLLTFSGLRSQPKFPKSSLHLSNDFLFYFVNVI